MKINPEQIIKLIYVMNMLSKGIDPTTGLHFLEDTILNNKQLKESFVLIATLLDNIIEDERYATLHSKRRQYKSNFYLLPEDIIKIETSNNPISVSCFAYKINDAVNRTDMKRLKATQITSWMEENAYLELVENESGRKYKVSTQKGKNLGISTVLKTNSKNEEYALNLYNHVAQNFILEHMNQILE